MSLASGLLLRKRKARQVAGLGGFVPVILAVRTGGSVPPGWISRRAAPLPPLPPPFVEVSSMWRHLTEFNRLRTVKLPFQ